jgi:hypothetical protein
MKSSLKINAFSGCLDGTKTESKGICHRGTSRFGGRPRGPSQRVGVVGSREGCLGRDMAKLNPVVILIIKMLEVLS